MIDLVKFWAPLLVPVMLIGFLMGACVVAVLQ